MDRWLRKRAARIPVSAWSAQSQNALNACEFTQALALARRAVAYADRWLPASHPSAVSARRALAAAYPPFDQVAEALEALDPALAALDELASKDPETAVDLLHHQSRLLAGLERTATPDAPLSAPCGWRRMCVTRAQAPARSRIRGTRRSWPADTTPLSPTIGVHWTRSPAMTQTPAPPA